MLPLFLFIFKLFEHSYNNYVCYYSSSAPWFPHGFSSVEGLLWGAEPRFELGPALHQADALLSEPRRTRLSWFFIINGAKILDEPLSTFHRFIYNILGKM
jgi:hypothetical protein